MVGMVVLITPLPSLADSWNTKANVSASWLYNDNPTLRPDDSPFKRQATSFGRAQARATMEYSTSQLFIDLAPRISRTYYPDADDSDLETTDFFVNSNANYQMQRNDLSLIVDYRNVGLLTDEFGDGVDTTPGTGATGNSLRVDDRVQRYQIAPEWRYELTRKDTVSAGFRYFGTNFKLEKTNRADNTNKQFQLGYDRRITARWSVGLTGAARDFESSRLARIPLIDIELTNTSESIGLTFDTTYSFSERTNMGLSIGRTETSTTQDVLFPVDLTTLTIFQTGAKSTNTIYNLTLNHITELNNFSVLLSQAIVPSSLGFENSQITINILARRRLSESITGTILVNAIDQTAVNAVARAESTFVLFSGGGNLAWRFKRNWVTSFVYTYRANNTSFGDTSQRGTSNQTGITLTYLWD